MQKTWEKRAIFSFALHMCAKYFTGLNEMKKLRIFFDDASNQKVLSDLMEVVMYSWKE